MTRGSARERTGTKSVVWMEKMILWISIFSPTSMDCVKSALCRWKLWHFGHSRFWPDMPTERDFGQICHLRKMGMRSWKCDVEWITDDRMWISFNFFGFGTFSWLSGGKLVKWSAALSRKWGFSVWWRGDGWWWQLERWRKIWRFKHLRSGGLETWELRHWRYKVLLPLADKAAAIKRNIRLRSFLKKKKTLLDVVMQTTPGGWVLPI